MIRRFGLIYALFSVAVLIIVVIIGLLRVNTVREGNLAEHEASFRRLISEIAASEDPRPVSDTARDYVRLVPMVDALVVTAADSGIRYLWAADQDVLGFDTADLSSFRGVVSFNTNEPAQIRLTESLRLQTGVAVVVDAVYTVLTFTDAYPALRDSLIMLVGFAFLTVLVLILFSVGTGAPTTRSVTAVDQPHHEPSISTPETTPSPPQPAPPPAPSAPEPAMEEIPLEALTGSSAPPGSLFNPLTGLSYQEFLKKRLTSEIDRAAYNDQDLSMLLIRIPEIKRPDDRYAAAAHAVLEAFTFEDLCFEYQDDAFCVLLPNTELSDAIRAAEEFQSRHAHAARIGIAARNGRLVEAERMLKEAELSLSRAAKETGGIVGFRPDPQKYRQYITNSRRGE